MKRSIVVIVVVVAMGAVLLFAAQDGDKAPEASAKQEAVVNEAAAKSKPGLPDYSANIRAESMKIYGDKIEWLDFSTTDFAEERSLIRRHYAADFEKAEAITKQTVLIAIAKADLNNDGRLDLVWKLLHPFYHGVSTSATLGISYYDDSDRLNHVGHFVIQAVPIGVRASDISPWKELILGLRLYRWDGKSYKLIVVPVETLADEKHFKVTKDVDYRYTIRIFDEEKEEIYFDRPLTGPTVTMYNDNIVRIRKVYHPGNSSSEYYDIKAKKRSDRYDEVLAENGNRVVYIASADTLIIRDMFDNKGYYKEVKMKQKFTTLVEVRRKAVLKVEWGKPDVIVVQYLAGPERRVVTEEIVLD
ncbi:MAG: hypothetical protein RIN56_13920 [Sporomusaceae bacterium]|nr:hypothetical protein [Sporomusaceae bacterium]